MVESNFISKNDSEDLYPTPLQLLKENPYGLVVEIICGDFASKIPLVVTSLETLDSIINKYKNSGFGLVFIAIAAIVESLEMEHSGRIKSDEFFYLSKEEAVCFLLSVATSQVKKKKAS